MAKPLLEQQWDITVIVAATGDLRAIEPFKPYDATTETSLMTANASLMMAAVPRSQPGAFVDETLKQKLMPMPLR